ncbi:hypothetical protein QSV08_04205 [Maribacter sp. BPC-D8]|uniref:hypothetical protein n=1 Tax=Maribacter sp. BPC-D8 TaxID=3053613 RepID=UPI002B4A7568|nr:hypothetical protein [Maribacter sp. BPC-D8]WRI30446.1 hypothetical protein QSV08_04205 [Maribacter sp. BPC-D8]
MSKQRSYEDESKKLVIAIDLAIEAYINVTPKEWKKNNMDHVVSLHKEWKNDVINPKPQFKNLASLKYHTQDVFTYFQDGSGETVEYFWRKLEESELDYKRENKLKKIIESGKIKGRIEYDYVTDIIAVAEQVGLTSNKETIELSKMLEEYQSKKKK